MVFWNHQNLMEYLSDQVPPRRPSPLRPSPRSPPRSHPLYFCPYQFFFVCPSFSFSKIILITF